MVTISAPTKAKITITTPGEDRHAALWREAPVGGEVRQAGRGAAADAEQEAGAIAMKAMIAATLIDANQNSNSP